MALLPVAQGPDRNADPAGKGRLGQTGFAPDSLYVNDGWQRQVRAGGIGHDAIQGIHEGVVFIFHQATRVHQRHIASMTYSVTDGFSIAVYGAAQRAIRSLQTVSYPHLVTPFSYLVRANSGVGFRCAADNGPGWGH